MKNTYDHIQTHITKRKSLQIILKSDIGGEKGEGKKIIQDTNPKRLFCSSQNKFSYFKKLSEIFR